MGEIFLSVSERLIAEALRAEDAAHPDVEFGSYPRFDEGAPHRTRLTIEGRDQQAVQHAFNRLKTLIEPAWIVREDPPTVRLT